MGWLGCSLDNTNAKIMDTSATELPQTFHQGRAMHGKAGHRAVQPERDKFKKGVLIGSISLCLAGCSLVQVVTPAKTPEKPAAVETPTNRTTSIAGPARHPEGPQRVSPLVVRQSPQSLVIANPQARPVPTTATKGAEQLTEPIPAALERPATPTRTQPEPAHVQAPLAVPVSDQTPNQLVLKGPPQPQRRVGADRKVYYLLGLLLCVAALAGAWRLYPFGRKQKSPQRDKDDLITPPGFVLKEAPARAAEPMIGAISFPGEKARKRSK